MSCGHLYRHPSICKRPGDEIHLVYREFVEIAHKEGLKVFIWNIDELHLVKPYADIGVDGIGSNDPRVLVEYFR